MRKQAKVHVRRADWIQLGLSNLAIPEMIAALISIDGLPLGVDLEALAGRHISTFISGMQCAVSQTI